jgi:hypothetical protein
MENVNIKKKIENLNEIINAEQNLLFTYIKYVELREPDCSKEIIMLDGELLVKIAEIKVKIVNIKSSIETKKMLLERFIDHAKRKD